MTSDNSKQHVTSHVPLVPEYRDDEKPYGQQWMLKQQQRDGPAICTAINQSINQSIVAKVNKLLLVALYTSQISRHNNP